MRYIKTFWSINESREDILNNAFIPFMDDIEVRDSELMEELNYLLDLFTEVSDMNKFIGDRVDYDPYGGLPFNKPANPKRGFIDQWGINRGSKATIKGLIELKGAYFYSVEFDLDNTGDLWRHSSLDLLYEYTLSLNVTETRERKINSILCLK